MSNSATHTTNERFLSNVKTTYFDHGDRACNLLKQDTSLHQLLQAVMAGTSGISSTAASTVKISGDFGLLAVEVCLINGDLLI